MQEYGIFDIVKCTSARARKLIQNILLYDYLTFIFKKSCRVLLLNSFFSQNSVKLCLFGVHKGASLL